MCSCERCYLIPRTWKSILLSNCHYYCYFGSLREFLIWRYHIMYHIKTIERPLIETHWPRGPGGCDGNLRFVLKVYISNSLYRMSTCYEIDLKWISQNLTYEKSRSVQVQFGATMYQACSKPSPEPILTLVYVAIYMASVGYNWSGQEPWHGHKCLEHTACFYVKPFAGIHISYDVPYPSCAEAAIFRENKFNPQPNTWRNNNIVTTSKTTSFWRNNDVIIA